MEDILKKLQEIEKINPNQLTGISFNDYLWLIQTIKLLVYRNKLLEEAVAEKTWLSTPSTAGKISW